MAGSVAPSLCQREERCPCFLITPSPHPTSSCDFVSPGATYFFFFQEGWAYAFHIIAVSILQQMACISSFCSAGYCAFPRGWRRARFGASAPFPIAYRERASLRLWCQAPAPRTASETRRPECDAPSGAQTRSSGKHARQWTASTRSGFPKELRRLASTANPVWLSWMFVEHKTAPSKVTKDTSPLKTKSPDVKQNHFWCLMSKSRAKAVYFTLQYSKRS